MTSTLNLSLARRRMLLVAVLASGTLLTSEAHAAVSDYGLEEASVSTSTSQAGAHPDLSMVFEVKTDPNSTPDATGLHEPFARTKDITVDLPVGLLGNPKAVPTCSNEEFESFVTGGDGCPQDTQVGVTRLGLRNFQFRMTEPVFNMEAPGNKIARLGYYAAILPNFINVRLRSEGDYGLTATLEGLPSNEGLVRAETELWGVPADPSHDNLRLTAREAYPEAKTSSPPRPSSLEPAAFLTNPTSCGPAPSMRFSIESYQLPGQLKSIDAPMEKTHGCGLLGFDPSIDFGLSTDVADSPTGLDVDLAFPQDGLSDPGLLATANMKKISVDLPPGMAVNPSSADGLQACSEAEIGLTSESPIQFSSDEPSCPDGSKIGSVEIHTPVLDDSFQGNFYLADPNDNPFNNTLLAGYLVAKGPGTIIKLVGKFVADPVTGQVQAVFDNNPQLPFDHLNLHMKSGARAALVTPPVCGTHTISSSFVPWSAVDPGNPTPGEVAITEDPLIISQSADSGPCPTTLEGRPFDPTLTAGLASPVAGQASPFVLRLTRPDGHQEISSLEATTPPGLSAILRGTPLCSSTDAVAGTCPAASQIGSSVVGAGAGPNPFYVQSGKAFLGGPYDPPGADPEAPLSLVISVPAVAGPFDLGLVNVRAAIYVDPRTAQLHVVSDPIPQILEGIPLRVRDIRVAMDRPNFTVAPTNCSPMETVVTSYGISGATATDTNPFQVGDCGSLDFAPKLRFAAVGGKKATKRNQHPGLDADLSYPPTVYDGGQRQANIAQVQVTLPKNMLLDQSSPAFETICTRPQYAADQCPASTKVGTATAETPLLDEPLTGPVYLKSSDNQLPDLAADLNGLIDIDLFGRIDQSNARIRNTFDLVPDQPVSHFNLKLDGGPNGILVNANAGKGLCESKKRRTIDISMVAQNGDTLSETTQLAAKCGKKKRR